MSRTEEVREARGEIALAKSRAARTRQRLVWPVAALAILVISLLLWSGVGLLVRGLFG